MIDTFPVNYEPLTATRVFVFRSPSSFIGLRYLFSRLSGCRLLILLLIGSLFVDPIIHLILLFTWLPFADSLIHLVTVRQFCYSSASCLFPNLIFFFFAVKSSLPKVSHTATR